MNSTRNLGRVAGLWYILLVAIGPLSLIYIPNKLIVIGNPAATASNIAAYELLFRFGILADLIGPVVLIYLTLAFYRLFKGVDQNLSVQVIIFGGILPGILYFVNVVSNAAALMLIRGNSNYLSVFDQPQREALAMLFLRLHDFQITAAETLWGLWLLPLATLVYKSRFLPRFLGVWLAINGIAYIAVSFTGVLAPQYHGKLFALVQPALFAELALVLWLLIKGANPPATKTPVSQF